MSRTILTILALLIWLSLSATGLGIAVAYTVGAGAAGPTPSSWPLAEGLSAERLTLLMFIHPRCPCTHAAVRELERLQRHIIGQAQTGVYVFMPGDGASWGDEPLLRGVAGIPDVTLLPDLEGQTAAVFGAMTSGHVVLYTPDGSLRFSCGITPGRGHEGSSTGARAIRLAVLRGAVDVTTSRVFGCAIQDPERAP